MGTWLRDGVGRAARRFVSELLYVSGLTRPGRWGRGRLTIVTFHRVLPAELLRSYPLPQLAVTDLEFAWFLHFLTEHYACGSLQAMHRRWLAREEGARPLLALTFDDGQVDNYQHARPLLEAAGIRASFFVPVGAVDGDGPLWHDRLAYAVRALQERSPARCRQLLATLSLDDAADSPGVAAAAVAAAKAAGPSVRDPFIARLESELGGPGRPGWDASMTWDQLRTLARAGHEIGSHSVSHPLLTTLGGEQLERELRESKARIEVELGIPCDSFCYPNGDCDDRVVAAARGAGYLRAVTTAPGGNAPGADPLRLRREDMQARHARSRGETLSGARLAYRLSPLSTVLR